MYMKTGNLKGWQNNRIWQAAKAFQAVWAVQILTGMTVRNVCLPILFLLCTLFFRYADQVYPRKKVTTQITAAAFTLMTIMASHQNLTQAYTNRLFQVVTLIIMTIGFYLIAEYTVRYLTGILFTDHLQQIVFQKDNRTSGWLPLWGYALICLICWLPYFLYEFPGIMSPDSMNQFYQVIGMDPLSNHHPVVHTLLIGICYHIGKLLTADENLAISFYTVFQMCFMAVCDAFLIRTLEDCCHIRHRISLLILLFYAVLPYQGVFAVTIWKDVPFAGIMMLFGCILLRLLYPHKIAGTAGKETYSAGNMRLWIGFFITGCALSLFRSNGWYSYLLMIPFLLYFFRKELRRFLPCCLLTILSVTLIKGPVMQTAGIAQPDFIESCSIPLQQITRVVVDSRPLTADQDRLIQAVIDTTYIKQLYAPDFADNMKELVRAGRQDYLTAHKMQYLGLWVQLGIKYPGIYLQSWADMTKGIWYPDVYQDPGDIDGIIANQANLLSTPLIAGPVIIRGKEILLKLGNYIPLYGMLWSIGGYFWALVLIWMQIIGQGHNRRRILILLPQCCLLITLLIAVPVADFRYAYPVIMTMPLWGIMAVYRRESGNEN